MARTLEGKIALVAGATRGAGRGIATALGEAGATVYCTGRSVAGSPGMADPEVARKNGRVFASWSLADEYGFDDADGRRPHFVRWIEANMPKVAAGWKKVQWSARANFSSFGETFNVSSASRRSA